MTLDAAIFGLPSIKYRLAELLHEIECGPDAGPFIHAPDTVQAAFEIYAGDVIRGVRQFPVVPDGQSTFGG